MRKLYTSAAMFVLALVACSCAKMSGTLTKSDSPRSRSSAHGDYMYGSASTPAASTTNGAAKSDTAVVRQTENIGASSNAGTQEGYRRDYSRTTDPNTPTTYKPVIAGNTPDENQRLIQQYAEMDKLADVVLYEIDIVERRWDRLLNQYKGANQNDRNAISQDLDKLNADQLTLYKAYTKIYKNGKSDWPKVKSEVDATLLNLRGVDKK